VGVEAPLGPAHYFDSLEIEELAELDHRRVEVHAILVDGDRPRRPRVVARLTDPADEEGRVQHREGGVGLDVEVRCVIAELVEVFDPQRLQLAGRGKRGQVLLPVRLGPGDGDRLDVALDGRRIGGFVRLCGRGVFVGVDGILGQGGSDPQHRGEYEPTPATPEAQSQHPVSRVERSILANA